MCEDIVSIEGAAKKVLDLPHGRISYTEMGSGPTIVLLHGAPMTSLSFRRVMNAPAPRYRLIAPDFPGFGRSTAADGFGGTLADYSDFVQRFCETLDLSDVYLFLMDASGCIGLDAASRMPDRVAGLIIADSVAFPLTGRPWPVGVILRRVVASSLVQHLNRRLNLFAWLVATVAPILRPFSVDERREMTSQFDTPEKRDRTIALFRQMGEDTGFMARIPEQVARGLFDKSVLLLFGQFDPVRFAGAIPRFRRMFPRSEVRIIPFEEHFPILASGQRVGEEVDRWIRSRRDSENDDAHVSGQVDDGPHTQSDGTLRRTS